MLCDRRPNALLAAMRPLSKPNDADAKVANLHGAYIYIYGSRGPLFWGSFILEGCDFRGLLCWGLPFLYCGVGFISLYSIKCSYPVLSFIDCLFIIIYYVLAIGYYVLSISYYLLRAPYLLRPGYELCSRAMVACNFSGNLLLSTNIKAVTTCAPTRHDFWSTPVRRNPSTAFEGVL